MNNSFLSKKNPDDIKVDLHLHTTASDGTWRPETLVKNLVDAGIGLFAVTDHDSTENLVETAALAKEHDLGFIPGVEVITTDRGRSYHLLGLNIQAENRELQALLQRNRELMEEKDEECIDYLAGKYREVSVAEFVKYINNPERGGWKALNYLVDKNLCRNHKEFFGLFDQWGNPFDKLVFASPAEVIRAIGAAGGVPILAHPGAAFYDPNYQTLIQRMIEAGIQGLECFHPDNSPEITQYCLEICKAKDLWVTGGSDCHGQFVAGRSLGRPDIRLSQLKIVFP